jgi:hypothetical protein
LLNGIGHVILRADLLDRAILATCPVIPDACRRPEAEFWRDFEAAHPRILGAALDAVSMALRNYSHTTIAKLPRMADFALWNVAAEPACPWPIGTFLETYLGNRQSAVESGLDGDPIGDVVRKLAPWEGTASDLYQVLNQKVPEPITKRKDWFSKPRQVADALRRLAPGLRRLGLEVTFTRAPHTRRRLIRLEQTGDDASPASPASPGSDSQGFSGPDGDDGQLGRAPASPYSSPRSAHVSGLRTDGDDGDEGLPLSSDEVVDAEF